MALNSTGAISLGGSTTGQSIAVELGQSATAAISLNDTVVRTLAGAASGAISMNDLRGKSSVVAPSISVAPLITGIVSPGYTLTSSTGSWSGTAPTYSYQWKRSGTNIGSNSNTYTLTTSDIGYNITCTVTATNLRGSASSSSSNSGLFYNSTSVSIPSGTTTVYLLGKGGDGAASYTVSDYYPSLMGPLGTIQDARSPMGQPGYPFTGVYFQPEYAADYSAGYFQYLPTGNYEVWYLDYWVPYTYTVGASNGTATTTNINNGGNTLQSPYTFSGGIGGASTPVQYTVSLTYSGGGTVSTSLGSGNSQGYIYVGYFV